MTQKFKCPQKTHKFLRIERNRIENTEISIFYILYSVFLKWYDIRIPVSLGRCEHRLLDCTKISTYQITNIKIFLW